MKQWRRGPVRPDRHPRPQPPPGRHRPDLLRRYLQSPDPDRYITRESVQHLDGLPGAVPEDPAEPVWTTVGRHTADDGS
ncbi:hypothetical protein [Streptomyces collinus]|uniref:hypothetical protein n=1 Tax=Streptomyces collinus TaxID=42684 RepID=UPI0029427E59|nr:hypothetical protein [Streptomyces collinus]